MSAEQEARQISGKNQERSSFQRYQNNCRGINDGQRTRQLLPRDPHYLGQLSCSQTPDQYRPRTGIFHDHAGLRAELADQRDCVVVDGSSGLHIGAKAR